MSQLRKFYEALEILFKEGILIDEKLDFVINDNLKFRMDSELNSEED